jgi:branched-chain amino acid transport system substrate-binding protein
MTDTIIRTTFFARLFEIIKSSRLERMIIRLTAILLLHCTAIGTAFAAQSIRIAAIFALSGPTASSNISSLRGMRWAVEEINASGGVLGRALEVIEIDNRSTPIGSKVAAEQAVKIQATAIIGPAYSSHALAVAHVAQAAGIPMISNVATNPMLTRIGNYIFRVCYNDDHQGRVMGRFAYQELKHRRVLSMVNIASDYSLGLASTFETSFMQHGGILLARSKYKARQSNFRDLVEQAKTVNPDAIFIAGHDESARIILEVHRNDILAVPLGGDGWDDPSFYEMGGNRIKLAYYTTHWSETIDSSLSKRFVKRYRKGNILIASTALAYDAVNLLADAISRAASTRRTAIRAALAETKGFEGVTGELSFDAHGDPIKSIVIMQIVNGRPNFFKQVHPEN